MAKIKILAQTILPTEYGDFSFNIFEYDGKEEIFLQYGEFNHDENVMVRIHSECVTGEIFHSLKCDCGQQLEESMKMISKNGSGMIIYLHQEGRGIGLLNKIKAYELQRKENYDTYDANKELGFAPDSRDYQAAINLLQSKGISTIKLITNNPDKISQLEKAGIKITKRVKIETVKNKYNEDYLKTKKEKFNHLLSI